MLFLNFSMAVFKPRARILLELGNQLIRNENIAIFELSKNSYDADATNVRIELKNIDSKEKGEIIIEDNGSGMNMDIIKNIWLEPGTDYREKQIKEGRRSEKFKRLPLGQKGIGRFAVHKLGKKIEIITKKNNFKECVIRINWDDFEKQKYLDEVNIEILERDPEYFLEERTGTKIIINKLWKEWERALVRDVYRSINSICSPVKSPNSFNIDLIIKDPDKLDWLKDLVSYKDILNFALFKANAIFKDGMIKYKYKFMPEGKLEGLKNRLKEGEILLGNLEDRNGNKLDINKFKLSSFEMEFFMYDFTPLILNEYVSDKKGLKDFMRNNGGIKVYKEGVRIYDYGEPDDDWLELDLMRVQRVNKSISRNLVLGNIYLKNESSLPLEEKTNREGFIEDEQFELFRQVIIETIVGINTERSFDKTKLKEYYDSDVTRLKEPVLEDIDNLRESIESKIKQKEIKEELIKYVDNIEKDFIEIRDRLLITSSAGMNFSIAIHEMEKIIQELNIKIGMATQNENIIILVKHLYSLLKNYTRLISRKGFSQNSLVALTEEALFGVEFRLKVHEIELEKDFKRDFECKTIQRMIVSSIMNLIDNAIWWVENKKPDVKRIYVGIKSIDGKPAIIIGDNGTGFQDNLEYLVKPFISRKKYSMGLGLHIVNEIMKEHGGKLKILSKKESGVSDKINGAIIAMIFEEK